MRKFNCIKTLVIQGEVLFTEGISYKGHDIGGDWVQLLNAKGATHGWNVTDHDFNMYFFEAPVIPEMPKAPAHYDNSKGSLYKVATERKWNGYLFDVVKRLERGGKKDPLRQEIEKSIYVLQLWLEELD